MPLIAFILPGLLESGRSYVMFTFSKSTIKATLLAAAVIPEQSLNRGVPKSFPPVADA